MRVSIASTALVCAGLASGMLVPKARADEWNKKMTITVTQPVQIPGKVLEPGTYVFRLAESLNNRDIVQILNEDETEIYDTVIAIKNYRLHPRGSPVITLEERGAAAGTGTPDAIQAIFYPGDNYGQEFVYPKGAVTTAAAAPPPPPPPQAAPAPAPECPQPCPPPQPQAQAQPAPQPPPPAPQPEAQAQVTQPAQPQPQPQAPPAQLPRTASNEPLIALLGLLSLAAGFGVRALAKRSA